jgi:hypothetical protein
VEGAAPPAAACAPRLLPLRAAKQPSTAVCAGADEEIAARARRVDR